MKTDNFDEAFRRKVESFHPPFRDDEIDRIHGYVKQNIPLSFWQRFGHTFTYSVGAITIVTLLTTTFFQANENKSLLNKIAVLSKKSEQKQSENAKNEIPQKVFIEKTDTVFVTKYISAEKDVAQTSDARLQTLANENDINHQNTPTTPKQNVEKNIDNSLSDTPNLTQISNEKQKVVSGVENVAKQNSLQPENHALLSVDKGEKQIFNDRQQALPSGEKAKEGKIITQKTTSPIENQVSVIEQVSNLAKEQEAAPKPLIINELKNKNLISYDLKNIDNLTNRQFILPNFTIPTKQKSGFKLPSIALPNLKYRVGLGTNAGFGQAGASLLTDVLFAKRWSFTSGINMSFAEYNHFGDEYDFRKKTDKDFRNQYPIIVPTSNLIQNIDIHQLLFRVPIYLNYRLPLRKDFTVLFSTGTDVDFNIKQFTSYAHNDYLKAENSPFLEKIPVVPFNNWLLSAGIEKRWKHYSVQLSPYFSTQIKQVAYRKDNFSFGFKLNGFYRLSR